MVRVIGSKTPKHPKPKSKGSSQKTSRPLKPDPKSQAFFKLLGASIAIQPKSFVELLAIHGVQLEQNVDTHHIIDVVISRLGKNNPVFIEDLATLLSSFLPKPDNFNGQSEDHFAPALIPVIGTVAQTVGGLIGNKQQQKAADKAARHETLNSLMQAKTQQQQAAALAAQSQQKPQNNTMLYLIGAILLLLGIGGAFYFLNSSKKQTITPKTSQ